MTHGILVFDTVNEYEEWSKTHLITTEILKAFTLDDGQLVIILKGEE